MTWESLGWPSNAGTAPSWRVFCNPGQGRGISPPEISRGRFFTFFRTQKNITLSMFQRTKGGSHKWRLFQSLGWVWDTAVKCAATRHRLGHLPLFAVSHIVSPAISSCHNSIPQQPVLLEMWCRNVIKAASVRWTHGWPGDSSEGNKVRRNAPGSTPGSLQRAPWLFRNGCKGTSSIWTLELTVRAVVSGPGDGATLRWVLLQLQPVCQPGTEDVLAGTNRMSPPVRMYIFRRTWNAISQKLLGRRRITDLETSHTCVQTWLHHLPALPPWTCDLTPGPR